MLCFHTHVKAIRIVCRFVNDVIHLLIPLGVCDAIRGDMQYSVHYTGRGSYRLYETRYRDCSHRVFLIGLLIHSFISMIVTGFPSFNMVCIMFLVPGDSPL